MTTKTRIYRINDRLVRASNAATAVRHVARDFKVRVASQDDIATLVADGVKTEIAGAAEEAPETSA